MIVSEYYTTRPDGVNLYRTYSDENMLINKVSTEEIYSEAIDVEDSRFTYTETNIPIEEDRDITLSDTLNALNELGVDTSD